ncbi:MAG TPA: dienelactone hydrolase family protein [Burkholderiales bacterium]|nr:dienelactone hydrolase family protein [Burkholderiales bacterium]
MPGKDITVRSREGGAFACYLVTPELDGPAPAIVLASTVRGVDADIRAIADEFAAHGFFAAAPDLFWRANGGARNPRSRVEQIQTGESDMADTLAHLGTLAAFNGMAVAMGFCYGGPYAILGPKRLGYAAGISCHGSEMLHYVHALDGVDQSLCILWGDQDHRAPIEVLDAYRVMPMRMKNLEVHVFPGVFHGYMMRGNPMAFDARARDFSMARALAMLGDLA